MTEWRVGPIGQDWIDAYAAASGDDNPLHRPAHDRAAIVHGALLLALMERFVARNYPQSALVRMEARFLRPLAAGAEVTFALGAARQMVEMGRDVTQIRITARSQERTLCLLGDVVLAEPETGG